jgi:hypothetical protein
VDEDERALELSSHAAPRAERCLWLGIQLALVSAFRLKLLATSADSVNLARAMDHIRRADQAVSMTHFAQGLESSRLIRSTADPLPCR